MFRHASTHSAWSTVAQCALWLIVLAALILIALPLAPARAAGETSPDTGLYDEAGVLNEDERQEIEARISDVEAAGAPTVVLLRLKDSEVDRAVRDAQQLMEDWNLESAFGARDGFVILLNLETDDPDRGELGVVAGEAHFIGGALPQSELNRIRDEMIDRLADDRMADGIVHGLELTEERLQAGPPEPSAFESFVQEVAEGPLSLLNALSAVIAVIFGVVTWRIWQDRPKARERWDMTSTEPPDDTHPAIAGALTEGRIDDSEIEATIITLGRRGALQFEPDPKEHEQMQIRLLDQSAVTTPYEYRLFEILSQHATHGVLKQDQLHETMSDWDDVKDLLRGELRERGWYDPEASRRRRPLYIYGVASILLAVPVFFTLSITEEAWQMIGVGLLLLTGLVLVVYGATYPSTTHEGERAALPWRGYRTGLKDARHASEWQVDLEEAFPYIVAMSLVSDYHDQLEKASEEGYIPSWFQVDEEHHVARNNWFVYWVAFHGAMSPQSSGGGSVPGGAATGSGGAGGRF